MTTTKDLVEILGAVEKATEGSREIDEAIAEALLDVKVWKSKHGYWNVTFPNDWPYQTPPDNLSMAGRRPDEVYDPATGKKLPPETQPHGWSWDVELPAYTSSIDAALALVEKMLRPDNPHMTMNLQFIWTGTQDRGWCRAEITWPSHERIGHAPTAPLAIIIALLNALLTKDTPNANG